MLGKGMVAAHHGALAKRTRLAVERKLQNGQLRAVVATASLELGIDIGDVELVCQLGSPRSIAVLRQRIGRAHHAVGGTPKGRIFAMTRDELVECAAAARAMVRGQIDRHVDRPAPLDVLAQQLVATCASAPRRLRRRRAVRAGARRRALRDAAARRVRRRASPCSATASPRGAAARARTCTSIASTSACAAGAARAWPR